MAVGGAAGLHRLMFPNAPHPPFGGYPPRIPFKVQCPIPSAARRRTPSTSIDTRQDPTVAAQHIQTPIHRERRTDTPRYGRIAESRSWPHGAARRLKRRPADAGRVRPLPEEAATEPRGRPSGNTPRPVADPTRGRIVPRPSERPPALSGTERRAFPRGGRVTLTAPAARPAARS